MADKRKEVFVPVETPKVEPMMLVRTVVFVVAIINAIAAMFGSSLNIEVDQGVLYEIFSGIFLIGSGIWAAWKDNNITKKARKRKAVAEQVEDELN